MTIYIIVFFIIVISSLTVSQLDRYIGHLILKLIFTALVFIVGFRHQVGGDWYTYLIMYDQIAKLNLFSAILFTDPAYGLLNFIAAQWDLSIYFVNFVCAAIFIMGLACLCFSLPQPWFALLVSIPYLVTVVAMGYSRQAAAIGLGMIAFVMILERKAWYFTIYIILASLFHKTALFLFLFFPLSLPKVNIGKVLITFSLLTFIVVIFFVAQIGAMWELYVGQGMVSDGGLVRVLLNVAPALLFIVHRKEWHKRWPNYYGMLLWFSSISLILLPLQFLASTAVDRIALYIIPLQIIVFSTLPLLYANGTRYILLFGIIITYFFIYWFWLTSSYYAQCCWIPYGNYLFL